MARREERDSFVRLRERKAAETARLVHTQTIFDEMKDHQKQQLDRVIVIMMNNIIFMNKTDTLRAFLLWKFNTKISSVVDTILSNNKELGTNKGGQELTATHVDYDEIKKENLRLKRLYVHRVITRYITKKNREPMRRAISKWKNLVILVKNDRANNVINLKDNILHQQRMVELEQLRDAHRKNQYMSRTLMCALFFFRWKLDKIKHNMVEKEEEWVSEKKIIRKELIRMRSVIVQSHASEGDALYAALSRGAGVMSDLKNVYQNLREVKKAAAAASSGNVA